MKRFFNSIIYIPIFILAFCIAGCEGDEDVVVAKLEAGFTYTLNTETGTVTFINTSENASSYEWNFGDGSSSTLINPIKVYKNGTYTIVLKANDGSGGSDTFQSEITILIPEIASIPISFDGTNTNYNVDVFNGASFAIVDNPDPSGSNTEANKVGAITNSGAAFEGIVFELGEPVDLATEKTIKMDFWSNAPVSILLKLEISPSEFTEVTVNHGGTGWEEVLFNFSSSSAYPKLVIFVDGPGSTSGTFYFDNITQEETVVPPCEAETEESLNPVDLNMTFLSDPEVAGGGISVFEDNVNYEYVDNPDATTDANKSCKVAKVTKAGVQPWDNLQFDFDDKFTFTDGSNFTIKVYSPVAGYNITMKLEDKTSAGAINSGDVLSTTQTTKTNEWEELTIPFNAVDSGKYDKMVIFFDLQGAANTNSYFIDDIKLNLGSGGGGGQCEVETMQSLSPDSFNLTFMNDPGTTATQGSELEKFFQDNVTYEYVDNPDSDNAVNPSCKVGKVTKSGVQPWDNLQIDFADKFTITDNSNFSIKVFSPVSGYKVTLKLEDKTTMGSTNSGDRASTVSTAKTNEWEELIIPFNAADSDKYDRLVIFFDLEGPANTNEYYFDDLKLNLGSSGGGGSGGGTGGGCTGDAVAATSFPVNFESCESFISTFTDSGSMTTTLDDNPSKTGINTSDFVLRVNKAAGSNRWAGFQNAFPSNFDATKTFKFKIYSTKANVVMRFEVNSDPQPSDSGNPGPQFATITDANTWTEVEITFTGIPPSNTGLNQLVIKPDNPEGTDGETTTSDGVYYFDDIRLE